MSLYLPPHSNNGGHKSASERKLLALEQEIANLRNTVIEFNAFLNYMLTYHPTDPTTPQTIYVNKSNLQELKMRDVRSELKGDGIYFTFCDDAPRIIIPR